MNATCSTCERTGKLGNSIMKVGTLHLCKDCAQIVNDRIKLAEAMGWKQADAKNWIGEDPGLIWASPDGREQTIPPDPENDANDDYAVLQWMREDYPKRMPEMFSICLSHNYEIGDYARAALKALK